MNAPSRTRLKTYDIGVNSIISNELIVCFSSPEFKKRMCVKLNQNFFIDVRGHSEFDMNQARA